MFTLETKLLIVCKQVFSKITDKHNSKIFDAAVTRAIGLSLFLSLVSPVLFVRMLKQDGRSLQIVNNPEHEF